MKPIVMPKSILLEAITWLSFGVSLTVFNEVLQIIALLVAVISGLLVIIDWFIKHRIVDWFKKRRKK